jgi:hypothetical protein
MAQEERTLEGSQMTVRPPLAISYPGSGASGHSVLEYELMAEQASALGSSGRAAETALAALATGEGHASVIETERLIDAAAQSVWSLFIQREMCGMKNGPDVIARYGIPSKVLARLGAAPRHR